MLIRRFDDRFRATTVVAVWLGVLFAPACGRDALNIPGDGQVCRDSADCSAARVCVDGACTTVIPTACTAGERACSAGHVVQCEPGGEGYVPFERCDLGCSSGVCMKDGGPDIAVESVDVEWAVLRTLGASQGRVSWQLANNASAFVPAGYRCVMEAVGVGREGGRVALDELVGLELGPGDRRLEIWDFDADVSLPEQTYHIGITCDVDDRIDELDEGNNFALSAATIDVERDLVTLRIGDMQARRNPVQRGQTLFVDFGVSHEGGPGFRVLDSVLDLVPEGRGTPISAAQTRVSVPAGTGWTTAMTAVVDIPRNMVPGAYSISVTLDSPDANIEQLGGFMGGLEIAGESPCELDPFEPNDRFERATPIDEGEHALSLCRPGDRDDYLLFCTEVGSQLDLRLEFDGQLADVDVELLSGPDEVIAVSQGTGNTEAIHLELTEQSCTTIHVFPFGQPADITYTLILDARPADADPCPTVTNSDLCDALPECRYLAPGCGPSPVAEGCYPAAECSASTCAPAEICEAVTFDPCWNMPCNSCGQGTRVCVASEPPEVDLAATAVQAAPQSTGPGAEVVLNVTSTNLGNTADAGHENQILLVSQTQPPSIVALEAPYDQAPLAPGLTRSESRQVALPANLTAGVYSVVFQVDATDRVIETDEANNEARTSIEIVTGPPPPCVDRTDSASCGATDECFWYQTPDLLCPGLPLPRAQCGPRPASCEGGCQTDQSCLLTTVQPADSTEACHENVPLCISDTCGGRGEPDEEAGQAGSLLDALTASDVYDLCPFEDADQFRITLEAGQTIEISFRQVGGTATEVTGLFFEADHDPPFVSIQFGPELLFVQTAPRNGDYLLVLTRNDGPRNVRYRLGGGVTGP
jgi:hypothetical protein